MVTIEDVSKKVSKDLNIHYDIVEKLHRIQYKFLYETMVSGNLKDVQLIYIGKFTKNKYGKELESTRANLGRLEEPSI